MDKLVSILIPVYNREDLIEETVQSARNQTYENIEIIIVDNKSTDNTWSVLERLAKEDSRIKIFQNETNIGPVRNWKRCIDEASGEYGKILWSDDLIAPEFLEKTIPFLANHDVGFVFTSTEVFMNGTTKRIQFHDIGESGFYHSEKYIDGALFKNNYPVSPGCALFRLKDLQYNLLINIPNKVHSDFSVHAIGNDLLIFLLTAHSYSTFAFVNENLSFFRAHEGSITTQSQDGKLILYYNLVSAYFVEHYRPTLIKKMNAKLWYLLKISKIDARRYNFDKVEDFYVINKDYNVDIWFLLKKILSTVLHKLGI